MSHQGLARHVRRGRIAPLSDGTFDLAAVKAAMEERPRRRCRDGFPLPHNRNWRPLEQIDDALDRGFVIAVICIAEIIESLAAGAAVSAGASIPVARKIARKTAASILADIADTGEKLGIEPFETGGRAAERVFDLDWWVPPDWDALAKLAAAKAAKGAKA